MTGDALGAAAAWHHLGFPFHRALALADAADDSSEAGYTVLVTHPTSGAACLEDPSAGGMGRHMLNPDLVDDVVVVSQPEVVIYEPMQNGKLRLVAVEYIIPYTMRGPDQPPPTLFGREFLHNPTFGRDVRDLEPDHLLRARRRGRLSSGRVAYRHGRGGARCESRHHP